MHNTVHVMIIILPISINLIVCILLFIVYCVHVLYVRFDMCKINDSQSVSPCHTYGNKEAHATRNSLRGRLLMWWWWWRRRWWQWWRWGTLLHRIISISCVSVRIFCLVCGLFRGRRLWSLVVCCWRLGVWLVHGCTKRTVWLLFAWYIGLSPRLPPVYRADTFIHLMTQVQPVDLC